MAINPGVFLEILIYGYLTWLILMVIKLAIESTQFYLPKEKQKQNFVNGVVGDKKTHGEPLNLIGIVIILLVTMLFIFIKVGFELDGSTRDYPAIFLTVAPLLMFSVMIPTNIIQYARGVKKVRRWGLPSETNSLSKRSLQINDIKRKIFHLVAMALMILVLSIVDWVIRSKINGGPEDAYYEAQLVNFWGSTNGLNYLTDVFSYHSIPLGQSIAILWTFGLAITFLTVEVARLSKHVHFLFQRSIQSTLRYKEIDTFGSYTHFALGYLVAAIFLPPLLFLACMCLITFADPIASYIGMRVKSGSISWNNKSWAGTLGGSLMAFATMFIFVGPIYSLCGAIGFALIDLLTPKPIKLTDNLLMPLVLVLIFGALCTLGIPCTNLLGL